MVPSPVVGVINFEGRLKGVESAFALVLESINFVIYIKVSFLFSLVDEKARILRNILSYGLE